MYRFLDVLSPEDVEAIAALAYVEMLEAGFAAVAEFHYLHHQPGGAPYADPAELAHRIVAAAADDRHRPDAAAGALQLRRRRGGAARRRPAAVRLRPRRLPARCARRRAAGARRRRGARGRAALAARHHARPARRAGRGGSRRADAHPRRRAGAGGGRRRGLARGAAGGVAARPLGARPALVPDPRHADDRRGDRPARRLAARWPGSARSPRRTSATASFPVPPSSRQAARSASAPTSNVRLSVAGELRGLEYSQRLAHKARNVLAAPGESVGATLYRGALAGGAQALARPCGAIAPGLLADLVAIDRDDPVLAPLDDAAAARRLDLRRRRPGGARGLVGGPGGGPRRPPRRPAGHRRPLPPDAAGADRPSLSRPLNAKARLRGQG